MCPRSPARPSDTSIAACARRRRRSPSSTRGSGACRRRAASGISGWSEAEGRAAELAGNPDIVAGPRAGALERHAGRHLANDSDADRAGVAAGGIPADEVEAVALGEREKAGGKRRQPLGVGRGQRERERRPPRRRAHRREVGEIHRERLVAERARLGIGQEVAPFDQHVAGHGEVEPGVGAQQRAVVADPEQRALRRALEVAADDLELVQTIFRERVTSSGRSASAIFSSTPFTKR